jgi:HK97 family phage major capsid protein
MSDLVKLREQYQRQIDAAKAIRTEFAGKDMPAEKAKEIDTLLGAADELKVRIDLEKRMVDADAYMNEPAGTKAAHHGWRESGPEEGNVPVDEKAFREIEVLTPFGRKAFRFHVPLAVQKRGYAGAFEAYARKGFAEMGPNDKKTLTEGVDTAGGFLVPEDYHTELIKKMATTAVMRSLARVVQTSRDMAKWPRINYATDDKYTSGVRLTWTGESPASSTTHRVTDPVFGLITIPVHTAMASMPMSNDLLEDAAFDVVGISSDLLAEAFSLGENDAFLNGSGVSRPMGLLTQVDSDGPASVAAGVANAISTSGDAHSGYRLVKLYYTLPAQYRRRATWLMNSLTALAVDSLVDAQDRPLIKELTTVSLETGEPTVIKGRPVLIDEFMPDISTDAYPIAFGDMSGYIVLDRVGFSLQRLSELYAETNITVLLARKRVGGYLAEPYRVKVLKAST